MTAEQMWALSGLEGEYEAWQFGSDPDGLASLVLSGVKRATCSAYDLYIKDWEPVPRTGDYSVILDSSDEAVCIIKDTNVYVCTYDEAGERQAYLEGEGDRTLEYWRSVHKPFFENEMKSAGLSFNPEMKIVCEEFEVVFPCKAE